MKAVRYHECGEAEVLRWEDMADPAVTADDVLIEVKAAGVNYADLMRRSGKYHFKVEFPALLGTEAAGVVVKVGGNVRGIAVGDRVFCRTTLAGCQAELVSVPAIEVMKMPDGLSFVDAAAVPVTFLTAYHMLKTLAPLKASEPVLIQAAASGVGSAAVQLAKCWGAKVIATASSERKLEFVRSLGADVCIDYTKVDFVAECMSITNNVGVDRVLECVGGEILTKSLNALAPGGRLMIYGRASGSFPMISPEIMFAKNLQVIGLNIGGAPWTLAMHRVALEEIVGLIASGKIRPVISETIRFKDVQAAHHHLSDRKTMGKVVLVP
jgi:NADPH:quinone reductase